MGIAVLQKDCKRNLQDEMAEEAMNLKAAMEV